MNIRSICKGDEVAIWKLCQKAFKGYPWFENMTDDSIKARWMKHIREPNFQCLVVVNDGNQILSVAWFHDISHETIKIQKGVPLLEFVTSKHPDRPCVWIDATVTDPDFQGRGMATKLKQAIFERILGLHSRPLILTRMRDDNVGIIKVNEKFGFIRTGIKITGSGEVQHEFWYRACEDLDEVAEKSSRW